MKNPAEYVKEPWLTRFGQTIVGCAKLLLKSHHSRLPRIEHGRSIIIMGNGPSLADTIHENREFLVQNDTMAVNFAANTPEFAEIKPKYYILADPHFFDNQSDPNVARLIANLQSVAWPMIIFLPFEARKKCSLKASGMLSICYYNCVGIEGFRSFTDAAYSAHLGMPRPRNVLIPAIMTAIGMGYGKIFITGADHSWTKTLDVDDDNTVVSIQPHFYKEDDKETARIRKEYLKHPLHAILYSFYLAFRAYYVIEDYARRHGVEIINATPGSFIDAFRRGKL